MREGNVHSVRQRVIKKAAEKTGFTEDQVRFVLEDIESSLMFYINYPMYGPTRLTLPGLGFLVVRFKLLNEKLRFPKTVFKTYFKYLLTLFNKLEDEEG